MAEGAPQGVGTDQAWPGGGQGKGPHPPAEDTWQTLSHRARLQGQQSCRGAWSSGCITWEVLGSFRVQWSEETIGLTGQEPPCPLGGGAEGERLGAPRLPTASAPSTPLNGDGVL